MATRTKALDESIFTAFVFHVLIQSEEKGDVLDAEEMMDSAIYVFDSDEEGFAAITRFESMFEMLHHPDLVDLIDEGDNGVHFHPALLTAAAKCRTRSNGRFPEKVLVSMINDLKATKYRDFSFE